MTIKDDQGLLTVAEAAQALKVSQVTLRRWLRDGRLPAYHVGPKAVRIRRDDLTRVICLVAGTASDEVRAERAAVRPWTEADRTRILAALEDAQQLGEEILARTGGKPLDDSSLIIREERDKRNFIDGYDL